MIPQPRYAYLDTSAFVKMCWPEAESAALMSYLERWPLRASSGLLRTEALRAAQRQPVPRIARVQTLLRRVALVDVDRALLREAGTLLPPQLRSLDAIHVAAALSLGPDLGVVIAYDQRMITAAQEQGLDVATPT